MGVARRRRDRRPAGRADCGEGVDCSAGAAVAGARSGFSLDLHGPHRRAHHRAAIRPDADVAAGAVAGLDFGVAGRDDRRALAGCGGTGAARKRVGPASRRSSMPTSRRAKCSSALLPLATHVVASEPVRVAGRPASIRRDQSATALAQHWQLRCGDRRERRLLVDRGCGGNVRHGRRPRSKPIDTLAAGDVFHAGFAVGLARGEGDAEYHPLRLRCRGDQVHAIRWTAWVSSSR